LVGAGRQTRSRWESETQTGILYAQDVHVPRHSCVARADRSPLRPRPAQKALGQKLLDICFIDTEDGQAKLFVAIARAFVCHRALRFLWEYPSYLFIICLGGQDET
jgi:hypothetical protein